MTGEEGRGWWYTTISYLSLSPFPNPHLWWQRTYVLPKARCQNTGPNLGRDPLLNHWPEEQRRNRNKGTKHPSKMMNPEIST